MVFNLPHLVISGHFHDHMYNHAPDLRSAAPCGETLVIPGRRVLGQVGDVRRAVAPGRDLPPVR
jgi:hypothetical protein